MRQCRRVSVSGKKNSDGAALRRQRQENGYKFKTSLSYTMRVRPAWASEILLDRYR